MTKRKDIRGETELGALIFHHDKDTGDTYVNCFGKDGWTGFKRIVDYGKPENR